VGEWRAILHSQSHHPLRRAKKNWKAVAAPQFLFAAAVVERVHLPHLLLYCSAHGSWDLPEPRDGSSSGRPLPAKQQQQTRVPLPQHPLYQLLVGGGTATLHARQLCEAYAFPLPPLVSHHPHPHPHHGSPHSQRTNAAQLLPPGKAHVTKTAEQVEQQPKKGLLEKRLQWA
jgi:hypothetical protein